MEKKNEIVLFETANREVSLQVQMQDETVWLTANQMAQQPCSCISLIKIRHYSLMAPNVSQIILLQPSP